MKAQRLADATDHRSSSHTARSCSSPSSLVLPNWVYLRRILSRKRHGAVPRLITVRYAVIVFFVLALGIFGFSVQWLAKMMEKHICLTYAPRTGGGEETRWGVGQIAAPFAWAGLAVDVIYELAELLARKARRTSRTVLRTTKAVGRTTTTHHWATRVSDLSSRRAKPETTTSQSTSLQIFPRLGHCGRCCESAPACKNTSGPEVNGDDGMYSVSISTEHIGSNTAADSRKEPNMSPLSESFEGSRIQSIIPYLPRSGHHSPPDSPLPSRLSDSVTQPPNVRHPSVKYSGNCQNCNQ